MEGERGSFGERDGWERREKDEGNGQMNKERMIRREERGH
jgi:hypothetical protein